MYALGLIGILYATGLHTEVAGQLQRLVLATGIKNADIPTPRTTRGPALESFPSSGETKAGKGFTLIGLDGQSLPFENLRGKVVFLNIWATWCPPCIAEMPNIQSLYEKVGSDKIAFVLLSVDEGANDKVQKFIDRKGYSFPVYRPGSPIPVEFQSSAIPTTFILSPEGEIMDRHEGMADYDTPKMQKYLQGLVKK